MIGFREGTLPEPLLPPDVQPHGRPSIVGKPARVSVHSDCWLIAEIDASDDDHAHRKAEAEVIPYVVSALSAGVEDGPYRAEVISVRLAGEEFRYSPVAMAYTFEVREITDAEVADAHTRFAGLTSHPNLNDAVAAFYRGINFLDHVSDQTTAMAILAFYQTLESASMVVPWSEPSDYDEQREAILSVAKTALNSSKGVRKRAGAIETAHLALSRLAVKFTSLRIAHAAEAFGLSPDWIIRAKQLGKFRNQHLGHGAPPPSKADLAEWAPGSPSRESAYAVAANFIAAAADYARYANGRAGAAAAQELQKSVDVGSG